MIQIKKPFRFRGRVCLSAKSNHKLFLPKVGVRRCNRSRSILTFTGTAEINCIAVATFLAVVEDKAVCADTFFFYQVSDNLVHMIPAELLFFLAGRAIANYHYFTLRV